MINGLAGEGDFIPAFSFAHMASIQELCFCGQSLQKYFVSRLTCLESLIDGFTFENLSGNDSFMNTEYSYSVFMDAVQYDVSVSRNSLHMQYNIPSVLKAPRLLH